MRPPTVAREFSSVGASRGPRFRRVRGRTRRGRTFRKRCFRPSCTLPADHAGGVRPAPGAGRPASGPRCRSLPGRDEPLRAASQKANITKRGSAARQRHRTFPESAHSHFTLPLYS
ncbi:hypothetical protein EVAR_40643_1 [Eumeta japonica]|uniref:Uncharacterized protein n=1 Tax=Eumeta variegata TaxID=151549 RepID=A0A4C1X4N6_EUMVA|nr:hypothetical protein EVAR_40643_1 [Eumeta japonica]